MYWLLTIDTTYSSVYLVHSWLMKTVTGGVAWLHVHVRWPGVLAWTATIVEEVYSLLQVVVVVVHWLINSLVDLWNDAIAWRANSSHYLVALAGISSCNRTHWLLFLAWTLKNKTQINWNGFVNIARVTSRRGNGPKFSSIPSADVVCILRHKRGQKRAQ